MLLANSGCQPLINGARAKNIKELNQCKEKIDSIYEFIEKFNSQIDKIIFISRGSIYIYNIGFGTIDGGIVQSNAFYQEYYIDKLSYNHKNIYYQKLENTFKFFDSQDLDFYYILENPELGFHPKSCMQRPFNIFPNQCRIKYEQYFQRQNEYRTNAIDLANKYKKVNILDPEKLYCDGKYCYTIKDGKMLYADDDHHSLDGSLEQAKYFMDDLISNEVSNAN